MNFAEKFMAVGTSLSAGHSDQEGLHHTADTVTIPNAHLLFSGQYERFGKDLVISDDDHRLVVPNYFNGDKRPVLISPDGAQVDSAFVGALTGHTEYAQAGGNPAAKLVGHIAKLSGSASIIRNGVTVDVQVGDAVYQSDVVQTGSRSSLGLVLNDGTAFNLAANARMMLNDLTFDANSTTNSSFITLVEGAANFVAGQVAKTGDMKVATPSAVIGIRGTAVKLDISSADGKVGISVIDQQDGQVHSVQVFKCVPSGLGGSQVGATCSAGDLVGTVSSNGPSLSVTPTTNFDVTLQFSNKTTVQIAQEFGAFQATLDTYNVQKQIEPNLPQHTENTNGGGNNATPQRTAAIGSTPSQPIATDPEHPATTGLAIQVASTTTAAAPVVTAVSEPAAAVVRPASIVTAVDTEAVVITAAPTVTAKLAAPTAVVENGNITSNAQLSGTGAPNAVVHFAVDGSPIAATATTNAAGAWTFTPSGLSDGTHTITASQTDAAGHTGTDSLTFVLDTVAPAGGEPVSAKGSDSGVSSTDNVSSVTAPTFTIQLDASVAVGDTVKLLLNGAPLAHPVTHVVTSTDLAAGDVDLTVTAGDLGSDGVKQVTAQFSDAAGNSSTTSAVSFTLDTTAPLVSIVNAGGATNQASQTIAGTVDVADAGATVTVIDGAVVVGTATVQGDGSWSSAITLNSASNSLTATVTDLAGNVGVSNSVVYTLTGPVVTGALTTDTGSSPIDHITSNAALSGSGLANTVLHFTIDGVLSGATATADAQGAWSFTPVGLSNGVHSIVASQVDAADNTGTATIDFTLDTIAPTVAITAIEGGDNLINAAEAAGGIQISGTAEIGSTLNVNGVAVAVDGSGNWTTSIAPSGQGALTVTAVATDPAGNTASTSTTLTVDTSAPTVAITAIEGGDNLINAAEAAGGIQISGTAEIGSTLKINGAAVTVDGQGNWTTSITPAGEGALVVTAVATDAAGNTTSTATTLTVDTIAPTVAITAIEGGDNVINAAEAAGGIQISGAAEIGSTLKVNGAAVTVDGFGNWTTSITPAGQGALVVTAVATDAAGNTASTSTTLTVDTTAPAVAITSIEGGDNVINAAEAAGGIQISGTADIGSTLKVNGTTVTVDGQGNWSTSVTPAGEGALVVTAVATDASGNTGSTSTTLTVDTVAPAVAITAIEGGDNLINAAEAAGGIQVSGTAEVGSTLKVNGASVTVDGSGNWTTSIAPSGQGALVVTAVATDAAGNTASTSTTLTVDTITPTIAITSVGGPTNQASQTITGTVDIADAGATVTVLDGAAVVGSAVVQADGSWSSAITLSNGNNSLTAKVSDLAGNTTTSTAVVYTLSTTGPTVTESLTIDTGSSAVDHVTSNAALTGTGLANTVVHFTIDGVASGATTTTDAQGAWSFTPSVLTDGVHTIVASQTDTFNNTGTASLTFTLDTAAPAVAITAIEGGDNVINATEAAGGIQVSGTAEIGSTLKVNGAAVTVDGLGNWTTSITPAGQGALVVTAVATDAAGNTASTSTTLTVDTVAPAVAITTIEGGDNVINASEAASGIQVSGTAEVGSTLAVNGTAVVVDGTGHWTTSITPAGDGALVVTAIATDAAGNTGSTSTTLTVDTAAPSVAITAIEGGDNLINAAEAAGGIQVSGTAEIGSTLKVNGASVTVDGSGNWTTSITPAGQGALVVTAVATDTAGNTASTSTTLTVDTIAPTIAITSAGGLTNQASQTITGTVDLADAGATVTVLDGAAVVGSAVVQADGSWSSTVTLSNGSNSLTAKVSDLAGNTTTSTAVNYTLSTTGPTVTETLTIDTGSSAVDHITSSAALSGTGQANTVVHFTIDGVASGVTTTADAQGAWSFTPAGLTDGSHTIVASQTDVFNNTGTASLTFTLDTAAPAVAITTIEGGDNLINATEAAGGTQIGGTAEVGSTLKVNGTAVTVDGLGNWTTSVTPAGQGAFVVTAVATDAAGNTASTSTTLTVDTIAPTIAISNAGGPTNQASQTITGTVGVADAGATVTVLDGAAVVGTAVVQANGSWSSNITLNNGSNSLTAKVSDLAGNTTTSTAVVYTLSTTGPAVTESLTIDTGSSAVDHVTSSAALSGTGLANTVVHFTIDGLGSGATTTADAQGAWSFTPASLTDGLHTIVASQTDTFNNTGTASLTFTLDTTAPVVAITAIEGGDNVINATEAAGGVQVSGTAEIGSTLKVNGAAVVVDGSGNWSTSITPSSQGALVVTAVATDAAGNTGSASTTLTVDTVAPAVAITTIEGGDNLINAAEAAGGIQISGTAEIGSTLKVNGASVTVDGSGNWTTSITPAGQGALVVTAVATDTAGNTASTSTTLTVDTIAPTIAITSAGGSTNQASQTITGTVDIADAGATVTVLDGAAVVGSAVVQADGSWSSNITLSNGSNSLTAKVSDLAGNTTTSTAVVYTLSTTGPTVTETLTIDTGSSAVDHITSIAALSGTGLANTIVHFTIDGVASGATATANAQGVWSFTPASLTDGLHTIVASQTDTFNNTGTASLTFTLDTAAPAVAINTIEGGDNLINATEAAGGIQISGTAEVGSTLKVNGATVTVDGLGNWTTSVTPAGQGAFIVTAVATDTAGNTASTSTTLTVDTVAPTISITSAGGPTNQASQTITGTVDVADAGATVTVLDGAAVVGSAVVQANGSWSSTITLNNGSNSLTAKVSDLAGNTTTSTAVVYTLSTTGPAVTESLTIDTGSSAVDHVTSNAALSGTGLANAIVHFTIDGVASGATTTADAQGTWSFTPASLTDGLHTIVASQTDAFNNTGTASLTFTLDTAAPAVAITTIEGGDNVINATEAAGGIQISGTAEIGSTLKVNGAAVIVDGSGNWSTSITPSGQGALVVTAVATDAAGNTASTSTTLTVDTVAPAVAITTIEGGDNVINAAEAAGGIQVSGTSEIGSTLTVNGTAVTVDGTGHWTTSITPSGQGALVVTAIATDAAGNTASTSTTLTVDTVAPAVAITTIEGGDNVINAAEAAGGIQISGTAEIGSTLTVNGAAVTVDGTGHWTTSITPAGQGALVVTAVATDAAGNTASTSTTLTVDTIAPTISITNAGGPTNQAALLVTGTVDVADAGATVTIFDGAATVGSAVVQSNGSWSSNITLNNGSNSLTARVSDVAGNTTTSTAVVYTLSTTGPTVTESLTIDTGSSAVDHITSNAALSGTGLANTVVYFTVDGVASGATTTADAQGAWSFTPTGLTDGLHTIVASQTDTFNNTGTASLTFTLDRTGPAVAITTIEGGDNLINASEAAGGIQISGTAEVGSTLTVNGAAVTVDGTGHWTTSITPAGQGALVVTAVATDAAGNTASTSTTLTVDTVAPAVAITTIEGGDNVINAAEAAGGIQVSGTAEIGSTLTVNGAAVTVDGTGHWTTSITPSGQGALVVTAIATDAAGNTASTSTTLTVDTVAPAVAITTIEGGDNVINASEAAGGIQVSGTADAGSTLTVNGAAVTVDGTGHWTTLITPAGQGALVVTAVATDAAGNTASTSTTLTVDTVAPAVAITTIEGGDNVINAAEAAGGIQISGTAEVGSTLTVNGAAVTVDGTGHWTTSVTPAGQGALVVTAVATDAAGNSASTSTTLTVDTIAPTISITNAGGPTNQAALLVTGTVDVADAGATVTIFDGAASVGSAVVQSNGSWSSNITLNNGSNSLTARVSDVAGNTTTSTAVVYTLSTTGPTVTESLTIDTGSSAVDHITSNAALSGTGLANTVVHFTVDGVASGATTTADAQGAWSFTPPGLTDGLHTIVASQTDTFNNTGTASLTFTLDTTGPAVAITAIEGGDNLINAAEAAGGIQISGTAEIGSTLKVNGSTVTVDSSGNWTTSITPAGQGALVVTAIATDAAGNTASTSTTLTVDTVAPAVAITTIEGGDNVINASEAAGGIQISGTADVGSTLTVNGAAVTVDGTGHWTTSITPAGQGALVVTAIATDTAGNTAPTSTTLTVDTVAPAVAITTIEGGDNIINASEAAGGIQISGTAEIGSTLKVNGTTVTVDGSGNWTTSITPSGQGALVITAVATDAAGNTASTSTTLTVDTVAPTVAISTIEGGDNVINASEAAGGIQISGTAEIGSTLKVNSTTVTVDGSGNWTTSITPSGQGALVVTAVATDAAGNTASTSTTLTVDTIAPAVAITTIEGGDNVINAAEAAGGIQISGTAEIGSTLKVNGTTVTVDGSGNWTTSITPSGQGALVITAVATDAAGNTASTSTTLTVDTVAPTVAITTIEGGDNVINAAEAAGGIQISGTAEIGSTLKVNGVTVTVDGSGNWTTSITPSGQGALVVTAVATDAAGNTASTSTTLTVDTIVPSGVAPILAATSDTGVLNNDNVTSDTSPIFSVALNSTVAAGDTVQLLLGGSALANAVTHVVSAADVSAGSVTLTVTAGDLGADGSKQISARFTDSAGNSSTTSTLSLTLDTTTPAEALAITSIARNSGSSLTLSGTNGALAAGDIIQVSSDGGASWSGVTQSTATTWTLTDNSTHPLHFTYQVRIVDVAGNVGTTVSQTIDGDGSSRVVANNLDTTSSSNVAVAVAASPAISGAYDGVKAFTFGTGNVTVSSASGSSITGVKQYGIEAFSNSKGNISVTTAANSQIKSGSVGIIAYNQAASIAQVGGVTQSLIQITANGTIDSGTTLTGTGSRPAGILAVYKGGLNNGANSAVYGNVVIDNFATITAAGGDGVRGTNYGNGNTTINEHAGATIVANDVYGITASVFGSGKISVTTEAGTSIVSGSSGIQAINQATAVDAAAGSTVSVIARGTIHTGQHVTGGGSQPQGISAGYFGPSGLSNTNVNGTVTVDNFANITADAGTGANAYNWGNGTVTLIDESNTNVWGALYGLTAYSLSSGVGSSGGVTINVAANATITAGALSGIIAIDASERNLGNISVTTSAGDIINSGGSGISASQQAVGTSTAQITGQVSVTAAGTINSGFNMFTGGGQPAGISAGYSPSGSGTINTFVHGNVVVDSAAAINAAAGIGINIYNFGTGTITATLEQSSAVTAVFAGLNIFAQGGGNITIANHGSMTTPLGYGINMGSGQPTVSGTGVISISNIHDAGGPASSGITTALGSIANAVIQVNNWSNQDATVTNSGAITATQFAFSRLNTSVGSYNGTNAANTGRVIVNNSGTITGNVSLSAAFNTNGAVFNNNTGGTWNVNGQSYFGGTTNAINNSGTINASGSSIFSSAGSLAISNTGTVNVMAFGAALFFGNVTGQGSFIIGDRAALEFGGSVAGGPTGQTVTFVNGNGLLTLDNPSAFNATIANLSIGDTIDFLGGVTVSSASISGSTLTVTDTPHSHTYTYQVTGAQSGTAFNILSADKITMISTSAIFMSDNARHSFTPATGTTYILSNDAVSGSGGGFAVLSTDSSSADYNTLQINQTSSINVSGTAVSLTTTGANIAVVNAGSVTSTGGVGISTNSATGSTDIINYGTVSGSTNGINGRISGTGPLHIVSGGSIAGTTSNGIAAISTLGAINVTTTPGIQINAGSNGILAQNQGTSVAQGTSSIVVSTSSGTINAGNNGISAGYLLGTSAPSTAPNPPNTTVFGNIDIENNATINAAAGSGISASNYGVGDITESNNATITATAAGTTIPGTTSAQYGIGAFNYGYGKSIVTTGFGSVINSGSTGINVANQATAIAAGTGSIVEVIFQGSITSGVNNNNSGSAPAGIQVGFNPGLAGSYNSGVWGDVLVNASGNITSGAGYGINAYNYGNGSVTVNLGASVNIQALTSATSSTNTAPYGIGVAVYGPGDIAVAMSTGDVITSGSTGVNAVNLATAIDVSAGALITVYSVGSIHAKSILTNSGGQPSGVAAGFFGGASATVNLNVNGKVVINNDANVVSDVGYGLNGYHYGNGDITINDASGTTVTASLYGIEAHIEAINGTGNIAVNVYANATINSTTTYGIFAYTKGSGDISVITNAGDVINSGSVGINATNEATSIDASANSSIVVTAAGTINSGTAVTGTGNPPAGIIAGYLGGTTFPASFPLTSLNGDVIVNNMATIVAAAGDGIRAYNYGIGDVLVNDLSGTITALGGSSPVNGFGDGISAANYGSGNINIATAAANVINAGSSGIAAVNKAPSSGAFVVPTTSVISVVSNATITSGSILTGSGDAPAGIYASYNPNNADVADDNVHGNILIDDYGSITAAAGTDGIRGVNYGTGTVSIIAEAGALISGGRYGLAAMSYDGGNVSITNRATVIASTAAIDATTTSTGTALVDNYGHLVGGIIAYNATILNEVSADWSINGTSSFTGTSAVFNLGTIDSTGTSVISGLSSLVNTGTIEAISGSLEIAAVMTGHGAVNIYGATVQFDAASDAHVQFTTGQSGALVLANPASFTGTVTGFDAGDIIDLKGITSGITISAGHVGYTGGGFDLVGNYAASDFSVADDGAGGSKITWNHHAPTIATDQISTVQNANGTTTVLGLHLNDTDAAASTETFTLTATTGAAASGSTVAPVSSVGSLTTINSVLTSGAVYNPGATAPLTDKVTLAVTDSFGATDTVNFIFVEAGGANTTLQGTSGKDVIFASNAVDILTGGGGQDQFVFAPTSTGPSVQHTVTDFVAGLDRLDVRQFASLSASSQPTEIQQGSDTLITLGTHDTVLLKNVVASTLHASDFIFHV